MPSGGFSKHWFCIRSDVAFALPVSVSGQAEQRRGVSVHSPPLRRVHSHQTVLQRAAGAVDPLRAPRSSAQSSGPVQRAGQDCSPPAAVLPATCQKLLLSTLPV